MSRLLSGMFQYRTDSKSCEMYFATWINSRLICLNLVLVSAGGFVGSVFVELCCWLDFADSHAQVLCCRCSRFAFVARYSGLVRCGLSWLTLGIWLCTWAHVFFLFCDGFGWWLCRGKVALCSGALATWRSCWTWLVKQFDFCVLLLCWTVSFRDCGIGFCILRDAFMSSWCCVAFGVDLTLLGFSWISRTMSCVACVAIWLAGIFSSTFLFEHLSFALRFETWSFVGTTVAFVLIDLATDLWHSFLHRTWWKSWRELF